LFATAWSCIHSGLHCVEKILDVLGDRSLDSRDSEQARQILGRAFELVEVTPHSIGHDQACGSWQRPGRSPGVPRARRAEATLG
jgi:hypothetical protein